MNRFFTSIVSIFFSCQFLYGQNYIEQYKPFIEQGDFEVIPLPDNNDKIYGINISTPQTINIPINGGIFCTGLNFWLEESKSGFLAFQKIDNIAYYSLELDNNQICLFKNKYIDDKSSKLKLASVPKGIYQLKLYGSSIFIYGNSSKQGVLYEFSENQLTKLYSSNLAIRDIDLSETTIAVCEDKHISFLTRNGVLKNIFRTDLPINGASFGEDNTIYISTLTGVIKYYSIDGGDYDIITTLINGPLDFISGNLYILFKQGNSVIKIWDEE